MGQKRCLGVCLLVFKCLLTGVTGLLVSLTVTVGLLAGFLHEVVSAGRRWAYIATARLQRRSEGKQGTGAKLFFGVMYLCIYSCLLLLLLFVVFFCFFVVFFVFFF